jgi:hypothetical protein
MARGYAMKNMKQLVAVVTRNDKSYWTRIGVGFENSDGSWNLRFDLIPTDGSTTIQLRDFKRAATEEPEASKGISAQPF